MKYYAPLFSSSPMVFRVSRHPWLALLPIALVAFSGAGCYRATGIQRTDVVAEEIPYSGGDRTQGLKAEAAPGDFFLGSDYLELAIDGTPFGQQGAVAGAVSGGSIIDAATVLLDQNFHRVSPPMDLLERLTPVLNQDPSISLIFDHFQPVNSQAESRVEMQGRVHDPLGHLVGAARDSQDCVLGLSVSHTVSLGKQNQYFLLETTVVNNSGVSLPVKNIGDFLFQKTGAFRFNVPAAEDMAGTVLTNWGVEIPGNVFGDPSQAVKAGMVAFMGVEPSGTTEDVHSSLGLLPMDSDWLVVTSDPQQAFNQTRPVAPQRLIAGSLPVASLAPGAKLVHTRRFYVVGGSSTSGLIPNQATGVFNLMTLDRLKLQGKSYGAFEFQPSGTAVRYGPWPAEFRIERKVDATSWELERLEWMEPFENMPGQSSTGAPFVQMNLAVGTYRMVIQNGQPAPYNKITMENLVNIASTDSPDSMNPLVIQSQTVFESNDSVNYLCPERASVLGVAGLPETYRALPHYFVSRRIDGSATSVQPLRIMVFGTTASDPFPSLKRTRSLGSAFSPVLKGNGIASANYGVYGFQAGNQLFATSLPSRSPATFWLEKGNFQAYACRGPLSPLETLPISAFDGQTLNNHTFTLLPVYLPSGWTGFDLPGASLATTGGILPVEKLSSALAEGVDVVGLTETDRLTNATAFASDFRSEFASSSLVSADDLTTIGGAPYAVGARSTDLSAYGTATALFTPAPTGERAGGARNPAGWTLADFLTQAQGQFNIVHRPRAPKVLPYKGGLFTAQGFDPGVPLGQGANAWWSAQGPLSQGKTQGAFDALELLRAEYSDVNSGQPLSLLDATNANAWFAEFKAVRADWFALLKQQSPSAFTKALGLSSAKFSLDTPVGLARTYLKASSFTQNDLSPVLQALQAGAAVASTGPLLDVTVTPGTSTTSYGPGSLVPGPASSWKLNIKLWASAWLPVDEVRIIVNGTTTVIPFNATYFTQDTADARLWTLTDAASQVLNLATLVPGKDAWVVVEAGVSLGQAGVYRPGSDWSRMMKGIYPIAVTNPIFVKANGPGSAYTPPGL